MDERATGAGTAGAGGQATARRGRLLLARHGETDANRPPLLFQGMLDVPLNANGRAQASALGDELACLGIGAIWSSPLARARETAEIVGEVLGIAPQLDERLMEGHRGRWEGRLMEDVAASDPERFGAWRRAAPGFGFPGGESLSEHLDRAESALGDIASAGRCPALVVCHGGTIRVALCARDPRGLDAFHDFRVPNTAVVELTASCMEPSEQRAAGGDA